MNEIGCVLIHGFTGSPKEVELLSDHLKKRGIAVDTPTLTGHGISLNKKEMRVATWKEWIESAETALQKMLETKKEVYLVGFSMGGMIAAYLASYYPVKKLVLLSASVFYMNVKRFTDQFKRLSDKEQLRRYFYKISNTPLRATIQFRRLVKELTPYIQLVQVPTIIIQGELDDIVDPKSAQYIYDNILSEEKYLHFLPKSKHMVCWDSEKEQVINLVDQFLFK